MLSFFTTSFAVVVHPAQPMRSLSLRLQTSQRRTTTVGRHLQLGLGLLGVGVGVGMIIQAGLGGASWDVVNVALAQRTGLALGFVSMAVGLTAGLLAVLCGARPGWRSLIPAAVVSPVLDITVRVVNSPADLVGQVGMLLAGMVLLAFGVGAYIGSENGAGPADLLFLQLTKTRLPVWAARAVLDGSVLLLGWSLGGPVGPGTLIVTAGMGPLVASSIAWFDLAAASADRDRCPAAEAVPEHAVAGTPDRREPAAHH